VKRFARLYPALLAYVCAMLPLTILLQSVPGRLERLDLTSYFHTVPFAVGYLINYWPTAGSPSLQHLWSLSCEMQFYLLAPILFILGGDNRFRQFAIWGGVLLALIISGLAFPLLKGVGAGKYHFEQAVWPMMLGFFCEYQKNLLKKIHPTLMFIGVCGAILLFLASMVFMLFGIEMKKLVIASGTGIFLPCFWAYSKNRPISGILGRTLSWLGKRTYSIYLWQQPLTICNYLPFVLQPLGSLVSILIGGISFQLFERRFLSRSKT
jgi:peptidoglycan/LPS O-acetylase OafA/YrhL